MRKGFLALRAFTDISWKLLTIIMCRSGSFSWLGKTVPLMLIILRPGLSNQIPMHVQRIGNQPRLVDVREYPSMIRLREQKLPDDYDFIGPEARDNKTWPWIALHRHYQKKALYSLSTPKISSSIETEGSLERVAPANIVLCPNN